MKILLVSSALAAASFLAPAFAQEAPQHAAPPAEQSLNAPKAKTNVTVETNIAQTPTATVEQRVETITPVSDRPKLDPETPIAPEVQAVASSGKRYTTKDIVQAQLDALRATPVSEPTTTITTTTTTPGG
jgi:hypothetical protein